MRVDPGTLTTLMQRILPRLEADVWLHARPLSLLARACAGESTLGLARWVEDGPEFVLALQVPGRPLLLAGSEGAGFLCPELVAELAMDGAVIAEVLGPDWLVEIFSHDWHVVEPSHKLIKLRLGLYVLQKVLTFPPASGCLRQAEYSDIENLMTWTAAFIQEALPHETVTSAELAVDTRTKIENQQLFIWEDQGQAVSMAAWVRPQVDSVSVSLVYTPPVLRGRGYAGACVAHLSQRLLEQGYQACSLYTDLANAGSNRLYQRIGYQHIADFAHVSLSPYLV
jgi:ribosomal protein S18 acetylase RimI-like enzyme